MNMLILRLDKSRLEGWRWCGSKKDDFKPLFTFCKRLEKWVCPLLHCHASSSWDSLNWRAEWKPQCWSFLRYLSRSSEVANGYKLKDWEAFLGSTKREVALILDQLALCETPKLGSDACYRFQLEPQSRPNFVPTLTIFPNPDVHGDRR